MTKKIIKKNLRTYLDLTGRVEDVIERLQSILDTNPEKVLHIEQDDYDGYTEFSLVHEREETDQEYEVRKETELVTGKRQLAAARQNYERLNDLFGENK